MHDCMWLEIREVKEVFLNDFEVEFSDCTNDPVPKR